MNALTVVFEVALALIVKDRLERGAPGEAWIAAQDFLDVARHGGAIAQLSAARGEKGVVKLVRRRNPLECLRRLGIAPGDEIGASQVIPEARRVEGCAGPAADV